MNIYVPSKNRVNNASFLQKYPDAGNIIVVVEPQDYEAYKAVYPAFNFMILPKSDQGISYVRNYIKAHSESNGEKSYWIIDDDINGFYHREGTKMIKDNADVLVEASKKFVMNGIALGGLEYQQLAWSATKDFVMNSFCDSVVWVDNTKTMGLRYRPYVEGKEDRDFAMQVIHSGEKTARTTLFAFSAPANGSNAGGLKESFYDQGKELICVDRMIETWGTNICQPVVKKNGRRDVKINWKEITNKQASIF